MKRPRRLTKVFPANDMNEHREKFLYFDLGNVIVCFDHERAVQRLKSQCETSEDALRGILFDSPIKDAYETGQISNEEFHHRFCEQAKSNILLEQLMFAASDIFWLNAEILPLLTNLKNAGYRLGILSNTCAAHWEFLSSRITVLNEFFDCRVLSYQVQLIKPNPEIYQVAEQVAETTSSNIFYTDDRMELVEAAKQRGWIAERFESVRLLNEQLRANDVYTNY